MTDPYFPEVDQRVDQLVQQDKFSEALRLLDEATDKYPDHWLDMQVYKAILLGWQKQFDACYEVIADIIQRGYTFPTYWKALDPLRERPGWAELEPENQRRIEALRKEAKLETSTHLPPGYTAERRWPLFLVLHGDGADGNLSYIQWQWKPDVFLERGFVVVYAQSSQVYFQNAHGWMPDPELTRREVCEAFEQACGQFSIDPEQCYLGGFSGGAIATVDIVFSQTLPVKGFVALCPENKPEGFTTEAVAEAVKRGMRGFILEGSQTYPTEDEREMIAALEDGHFPFKLAVNDGIGHAVPADFQAKLADAVAFLREQD